MPDTIRKLATVGKIPDKMARDASEVTQLLAAWHQGDPAALERLLPLIADELHRLAHRYMSRERPEHTLQTTALMNEAYLKLSAQKTPWQSRAHFFAIAAQIMRRILVDHARKHLSPQRGGGKAVSLDEVAIVGTDRPADLVALDDVLQNLAAVDERKGRIVELRYFGGLTDAEIADVLGISVATVTREWRRAKAFLRRELTALS
jgi:RNA polymerase sigma factor (TIGR02999 family)